MPMSKEKMDRLRAYVKALNGLTQHCTSAVAKARCNGGVCRAHHCVQLPFGSLM